MDIGTQSSDYLFPKETKTPTDMTTSISVVPANFIPSEIDKPQTVQACHLFFNQAQKLAESAADSSTALSPSFVNLSNSATTTPTSSSFFATGTIVKQLPAGESSTNIPETVAVNQEQHDDVTFSFKKLDATSAVRNDASQGTVSFINTTPTGPDYTSAATQKTFSMKNDGTDAGSGESATTSDSLTNISATTASSSTTISEINRTSAQGSETVRLSNEMTVTDSTASMASPKTSGSETNIAFTFKLPTTGNQQTASVPNGSIGGCTTNATVDLQSKDLDVIGDDGMMEAEGTSAAPTTLFSSSLSFGMQGTTSSANATQNVFGSGLKFLSSAQPQTSSLFGSAAAGNKGSSVFASGSTTSSGNNGLFSRTQRSSPASSTFSFDSTTNPVNSSSLFGVKPTTGGTTFGGAPSFGSKPVFGTPSPLVSAFGQQRSQSTASTTSGFSNFAKTSTVGFGSLAASQQQQSSVFGGSGFGALAQQPQKSSIFGGGLNSSVTNRYSVTHLGIE
uniref:RanBD1 domain-containing protein n=1 Tax=Elaeophora elaphi TaxID=1147741 RepID=A0A0R3RJR8_9BILA